MSTKVLKRKAEVLWIVILSISQIEEAEHILRLMQCVIIDSSPFLGCHHFRFYFIIGHEQGVSEHGGHVELLEHGIHIADTTKIPDTSKAIVRPLTLLGVEREFLNFWDDSNQLLHPL